MGEFEWDFKSVAQRSRIETETFFVGVFNKNRSRATRNGGKVRGENEALPREKMRIALSAKGTRKSPELFIDSGRVASAFARPHRYPTVNNSPERLILLSPAHLADVKLDDPSNEPRRKLDKVPEKIGI